METYPFLMNYWLLKDSWAGTVFSCMPNGEPLIANREFQPCGHKIILVKINVS